MLKSIISKGSVVIVITVSCFFALAIFPSLVSAAGSQVEDYLCELGVTFYKLGRYDDALTEFNKALLVNPNNKTAKNYVDQIFKENTTPPSPDTVNTTQDKSTSYIPEETNLNKPVAAKDHPEVALNKDQAMDEAFKKLSYSYGSQVATPPPAPSAFKENEKAASEKRGYKVGELKITGDMQLGIGVNSPKDFLWKRANWDLNERNWRMLSDNAFDKRFNTYDPRVFDSLNVDLDTENKEGFNFHSNIAVDPWSFTGKSDKTTITTLFGDQVDVELKYWSNTGYIVNDILYSRIFGNSFNIPEVKVIGGKAQPFVAFGAFDPRDELNVPESKIKRQFQPVREFWFDYKQDPVNFRVFPIAYQDQAMVSDDPLGISNHHVWWLNSPWLRNYKPGILNSGATPLDFTKGYYDNSVAYLSRDSNGVFLTALRGISFALTPSEDTSFATTVATPKNLWQEYEKVDNLISSTRIKHAVTDRIKIGSTVTTRTAFNLEKNGKADNQNYVAGGDVAFEPVDGIKTTAEVLSSRSYFDTGDSDFETRSRGNAYYFSLVTRYPQVSLADLQYGYDEIKPAKGEEFLLKTRFFVSRMDRGFNSELSSFHLTRRDAFWSRHLSFRKPAEYYYAGLRTPSTNWDEVNATRIGDGIDIGRDSAGFRAEVIYKDKINNLVDVRNVHDTDGRYVENVVRDELTVKPTDKLTIKTLGIYHDLPETTAGVDPFLYDGITGTPLRDLSGVPIEGEKDPSVWTSSLGLEYAFLEWLSANAICERTNDYNLGYDNFPRGLLNSGMLSSISYENDKIFRSGMPFLYGQELFLQPPYHPYNIYKAGIRLTPIDKMEIYIDYTHNDFKSAGQISDNMNHLGFEFNYMVTSKLGMMFKYTYSRWRSIDDLREGRYGMEGHHNFFSEFRYFPSKDDELILQYGEGSSSPIANLSYDPYGGSLSTIDTQHVVRAYYRRKF